MTRVRDDLTARYGFALDGFQLEAIDALERGDNVLVAAPTGSGKTVVAEHAVVMALEAGRRAFYTTPVKALSNQKYHDLVARHGSEKVGLLTGDNAINGDAPIVVMTTEVLRNMIYARSAGLAALGFVVLDEVHFLQDTYRGPVWEEVIIHLPAHVRLVCLSATVSNAVELTDWITTVRGATAAVIETTRPVRLDNLYMVGDRTSERTHLLPTLVDGQPNAEAARLDSDAERAWRGNQHKARRRLFTPPRIEVVERLEELSMLPAIYFIFSRNQCDDAAQSCLDAGLRLTTEHERQRIRELVAARLDGLDDRDLAVLGHGRFLAALESGIAAHHAGMVPPFKEAVEACFVEGLVKVVFATETLAVGINMPARSVVIEKLTKFTGEHHEFLTPGEYTQLTGRAGRRGIDDLGHAVVLWSPFVPFEQVASLASSRAFHLRSSFRPTFNMAANLVRSWSAEQAHHLLNLSFAQYQADADVVRIEARLERRQGHLAELRAAAQSPYGDIDEYRRLTSREDRPRAGGTRADNAVIQAALARLRPGDVIMIQRGKQTGRAAVLTTASRKGAGVTVRVVTANRVLVPLSASEVDSPPKALGRIELPTPFAPNRKDYQREVARLLDRAKLANRDPTVDRDAQARRDAALSHPVTDDPHLGDRLKAAAAAERAEREVAELLGKVRGRSQSLARTFDRVLELLGQWRYVEGWLLTPAGQRLARLFHESDLLVVEALERGCFDGLDAPGVAALASVFTYEHRSPEPPPAPWFPSASFRSRWLQIEALGRDLNASEEVAGLNLTRRPDPTFVAIAYAWAAGEAFAEVVEAEELSGGDFVRNIKQLVDLLRQIAEVAPDRTTRRTAARAGELLFRGVVEASAAVSAGDDHEPSLVPPAADRTDDAPGAAVSGSPVRRRIVAPSPAKRHAR